MKSLFERRVSWFYNYNTPIPAGTVAIEKLLYATKHKSIIERIRTIDNKAERDRLKSTLPAFTPSCICSYRSQSKIVEHNGLIQFDIDAKDNPSLSMVDFKAELAQVTTVAYCGLSVSAKGLWGLMPIAFPEMHKQHFEHMQRWFKTFGVKIDSAPSNVVSLRGLSFDLDAYFNPFAEPLTQYFIEPPKEYIKDFDANGNSSIWQQYNQSNDFENVLFAHGWKIFRIIGNKTRYTRPDKGSGVSAEFDNNKRIFYVFTSSTEFEAGQGYSPFAVLTVLKYGGDFKLACKLV